jgi:hypothetical protein
MGRPICIGTAGRFHSEHVADFVGISRHTNILSENSEYLLCSLAMTDAIIQMAILNLFFK